jgi:hypothetical protein|tara:strand:- start:1089 stop:1217 length:129 start_codon:yes stop_codon:yes gene_type:complete
MKLEFLLVLVSTFLVAYSGVGITALVRRHEVKNGIQKINTVH